MGLLLLIILPVWTYVFLFPPPPLSSNYKHYVMCLSLPPSRPPRPHPSFPPCPTYLPRHPDLPSLRHSPVISPSPQKQLFNDR